MTSISLIALLEFSSLQNLSSFRNLSRELRFYKRTCMCDFTVCIRSNKKEQLKCDYRPERSRQEEVS